MVRTRRSSRRIPGTPVSPWLVAVLVLLSMLSSTLLIPAVRPFFAAVHPGQEGALHAFMSINMLGAILGAPALGWLADKSGQRTWTLGIAAVVDGVLLFACSLPLPLPLVLSLRFLQGAANVGVLSLLMGLAGTRGVPLAGGATIFAIALGAPLGGLLLKISPAAPLQVGAMLPLCVAAAVAALQPLWPARSAAGFFDVLKSQQLAWSPALLIFVERFAIGGFVVPFSLMAYDVWGFDRASVSGLYSAFLMPFAVATALLPRVFARGASWARLVTAGIAAYALCLFFVPRLPDRLPLALLLVVGGLGAAAVYAPSLRVAAANVDGRLRSVTMGLMNAAGSLGMLLGTAIAGFLSTMLQARGFEKGAALTVVFSFSSLSLVVVWALAIRAFARAADGSGEPGRAPASSAP